MVLQWLGGGRNVGIDLLRIWMCFEVVLIHFWSYNVGDGNIVQDFLSWNRTIAVSCFMFVSFILSGKYISNWRSSPEKLPIRILRLSIPIVVWTIIYFALFYLAQKVFNMDLDIGFKDIFWQLFFGHSFNMPMWFMNDLLYLTLVFVGICAIKSQRIKTIILLLLIVGSFVIEYTGLHGCFFGDLRNELKYPFGRAIEMIPYSCTGILFCMYDLTGLLKSKRLLVLPILLLAALGMYLFWNIPAGYNYGSVGLQLFIISIAVSLVLILIPFEKLSHWLLVSIGFVAKYTLGIYCMHNMMGLMLNKIVLAKFGLPENSLVGCLCIFALCLFSCYLISKIPFKWSKMIVS